MKKTLKVLLCIPLILIITLIIFMCAEEIVEVKKSLYNTYKELRSPSESTNFEEIYQSQSPFIHSSDAWYQNTEFIYHAGGGIDGLSYSNSKEALESTINHGNVIEFDFSYTLDNVLVCVHEWTDITESGDVLTLDEFKSFKIFGKYTPMTAEDLIDFMSEHKDVYIVIDTKEPDLIKVVKDFISICGDRDDIIKRFIIQLYDSGTKQSFLELYPFANENFLFTCYKYGASHHKEILKICFDENLSVVTVPYNAWDADTIELFTAKGIKLYEHTVNRLDQISQSKSKGIYGFYTDFIIES